MSELKVTGKLTNILNPVSGISKSGKDWNKQDFVITTDDKYPKEICFTLFGDKTDLISNIKLGDEIEVFFNLESREYEGRYFHNVLAWKVILTQSEAPENSAPTPVIESTKPLPEAFQEEPEDSDLPF
jgi:hypothetical protein